ncbi:hypothetical protein JCM5350_001603 [Sporobolomyces pararoseus]
MKRKVEEIDSPSPSISSCDLGSTPPLFQPIPSPLHGKLPPRPISTTTASVPLSPKQPSYTIHPLEDKEEFEGSINFDPPTIDQAKVSLLYKPFSSKGLWNSGVTLGSQQRRRETTTTSSEEELMIGEWKLGQSLGKGTSGTVHLARSTREGSFSAIKKIARLPRDHKEAALVHREIGLMKLVSPHPHLVELYNVFETDRDLYLVTEYCEGGELFQYISRNVLTRVERCRFYSQLISALLHLSKFSISHRDIKFENLLLYKGDHGELSLKLADMGMSTLQLEGTRLKTSCGSPHYAAPEVIQGEEYDGSLADVWSAGICLFAMVARRLPFDDPDVSILLKKIKQGDWEMDEKIVDKDERELIEGSLKMDPNERLTLQEISMHNYTFATIYVLNARFEENLKTILSKETEEESIRVEPDFENEENLELTVLASLGIVLKVSTLEEVKAMLRFDQNHARFFYSKLLEFRTTRRRPITLSLQSIYWEDQHSGELNCNDEEEDSISTESEDRAITPSQFPDPPRPPSPSFSPFDPNNLETNPPPNWNTSLLPPPRPSVLDSLAMTTNEIKTLHSAPPQTQKFPSYLNCLHEFGPIASAPPQIESFPCDPILLSPRVREDISRRNSVVEVDPNSPFLDLEDSPISPKPSSHLPSSPEHDNSLDLLLGKDEESTTTPIRKKPSMHQRIRSLLLTAPSSVPSLAPVSPRVSITEVPAQLRPPSPSPSTTTIDSRLTRSNAYRSLGRALLGKGPKSPGILLPSNLNSSTVELSFAERVVLETLVPSFSPIPSLAPTVRPKGKGKTSSGGGGGVSSIASHPNTIEMEKERDEGGGAAKTVRKSTIRKKMSLGVLQFFHDSTTTSSTTTSDSPTSPTTPNSTSVTKEKRRPKALSIASSNLLAVDQAHHQTTSSSPTLVKKLSLLSIGPSRSTHLLPPSPLNLSSTTTPSVSPRESLFLGQRKTSSTYPISIPTILRRRSTLSTTLSPLSNTTTTSSSSSSADSSSDSSIITKLRLEKEKLLFENELLKIQLESKGKEIELMKKRENDWVRVVQNALVRSNTGEGADPSEAIRKEGSKTQFEDEGEEKEEGKDFAGGTEEEWVESLKRLPKGFSL